MAVGVLGKKQPQDKQRIRSPFRRAKFPQPPKITDDHAANGLLAPLKIKQIGFKQLFMSGGRDGAYIQLVRRNPYQFGGLF